MMKLRFRFALEIVREPFGGSNSGAGKEQTGKASRSVWKTELRPREPPFACVADLLARFV